MDDPEWHEHLGKLHAELQAAPRLDADANRLLDELSADIARLRAGATAGGPPTDATLPDRLERVAVHFEVAHPTLAASSRRLLDILGKIGI